MVCAASGCFWAMVALLAEGVDRNHSLGDLLLVRAESPSSRRAWIEILCQTASSGTTSVALLAEGVDRNPETYRYVAGYVTSPSSRRAWIYTVIVLIRDLLSATPAVYR